MTRDDRRDRIVRVARELAEDGGWPAVTTRALCRELGFTQPVLYRVFPSLQAVRDAVALTGFEELAAAAEDAQRGGLRAVAEAYLAFAERSPQTYEAMFLSGSDLRFAAEETPAPLRRAFDALRTVCADEVSAEMIWASLHGAVTLSRGGRIPVEHLPGLLDRMVRLEAAGQDGRRVPGADAATLLTCDSARE